jgi:FGGY-family pentulose kinase
VRKVVTESGVSPKQIKGIGFDATCSLAVFSTDTDEPVSVTGPDFDNTEGEDRNVILWLDHRPVEETAKINNTNHKLLKYVGGRMSIEMEIPKALWLKNNMPKELFDRCKFYDLTDALTHLATGNETRSFCSTVCKQGYVPVGVDGSEKGWQEDFFQEIGLGDLAKNNFERMGGVNGVVRIPVPSSPLTMQGLVFAPSVLHTPLHQAFPRTRGASMSPCIGGYRVCPLQLWLDTQIC